MSVEGDSKEFFEKKLLRTRAATQNLGKMKSRRFSSYLLFSILSPLFFLVYLLISIVGLFSSSSKKNALAKYIRYYFKWYFSLKGITYYTVGNIPETFERPTLIIMPRYDMYSSLFAYQLFKSPVLIPLLEKLKQFRDNLLIPSKFIGSSLKHISYPDQNLDVCVDRVKGLLKKGYSVVVHLNQDTSNTMYNNRLYLSTLFQTILELDYDTYFLRFRGWEHYHVATFLSPIPVTVTISKKEELMDERIGDNIVKQVARIVEYFDFRFVALENHD